MAGPAAAEAGPSTPSAEARRAAEEVERYVDSHPRPHIPESSTRSALSAYAQELYAFLADFPWEAGLRQWDCSLRSEAEVSLHPETEDHPAYAGSSYGSRCGADGQGYAPTSEEIITPRGDALFSSSDAGSGRPARALRGCRTLSDGQHCLSFSPSAQSAAHLRPAGVGGWAGEDVADRSSCEVRLGAARPCRS